ncbi:MAG: SHOCT domain-containing protein [Sporichthyaceae bacterium]
MGLIKAAVDAASGVLGDQWKDFASVPAGISPTAALFAAVPTRSNAGRGTNDDGSVGVITNGSRILVPEGYGLVLLQDGGVTGFVAEPGAYEWRSDAPDSRSVFAGNGIVSTFINTSWERFKFGGRPQSQQQALFVSLKELPNNRFGTSSEIYWDDAFLNTQVGALARGTYTIRITDPILFVRNWVPATYLQRGAVFDFTDAGNDAATQLFHEVVGSLAQALSAYTNDASHGNRMTRIQHDSVGFARSLSEAVERGYQWRTGRGLEIVSTAVVGIEYDAGTRELLKTVQRADALIGARGNSNMQASVAEGLQTAGAVDGAAGILGLAMAAGTAGASGLQQSTGPTPPVATAGDEPVAQLRQFKQLLDEGLITQQDYDAAKARVLGL